MSDRRETWNTGELIAYTESEGPGRPPAASPTWAMGTLIGIVGVTFVGLMSTDTLCPDHRAWVQTLAAVGSVAMVGALVGLVRGWASAPILTLFASSLGVSIGLIDAVHSPTRGRLIALAFAVAVALAAAVSVRVLRLRRWDRTVRDLVAPAAAPAPVPVGGTALETPASIEAAESIATAPRASDPAQR